jgi:hypothetical protein
MSELIDDRSHRIRTLQCGEAQALWHRCTAEMLTGSVDATSLDFNERSFIVIWETTQACDLACLH